VSAPVDESTTPEATTETTSAPPSSIGASVPEGVVLGTAITTAGFPPSRIVGHRDGFIQMTTFDGRLMMSRSVDGSSWESIPTDLAVDGVSFAASTGSHLFVVGFPPPGSAPGTIAAFSTDDGATWRSTLLNVTASTTPYVTTDVNVSGFAATGDHAVAIGSAFSRVDWQAYAVAELGADHGHPVGEGTAASGGPTAWRVEFADGFELNVDLAELGLEEIAFGQGPTPVGWAWDGAGWEQFDPPFGSSFGMQQLVSGPAGFLTIAPPRQSTTGEMLLEVLHSLDGRNWEGTSLPDAVAGVAPPFAVGGVLGYVLIGEDVLFHSVDGTTWSEVHRFEDLAPDISGFLSSSPPAGGPIGFVISMAGPVPGPESQTRVMFSADGLTWEEVPLPSPSDDAIVAVSDRQVLVVPLVIDTTLATPRADFPDDASLAAAIAESFYTDEVPALPDGTASTWRPVVTASDAACIADGLIDTFGRQRLQELGFATGPWHLLGYALGLGPFDRFDAERIVDTFRSCASTWELLMILSATQGTDLISDESAACVSDAMPDDEARELFITELDRPYDDGDGDLSHLERLAGYYEECLTPEELARLDWN
jgi:hypothetical protein